MISPKGLPCTDGTPELRKPSRVLDFLYYPRPYGPDQQATCSYQDQVLQVIQDPGLSAPLELAGCSFCPGSACTASEIFWTGADLALPG